MNIKSLINETEYTEIWKNWHHFSETKGFYSTNPTSTISSFWNTTFTPSSTEIIFRQLLNNNKELRPLSSCQPCVRLTDLHKLSGGWHLLLFHILFNIQYNIDRYEDDITDFLNQLSQMIHVDVKQLYFTVPQNSQLSPGSPVSLGAEFLRKLNIPLDHILINNGTANYQKSSLALSNKQRVEMEGPKIEIFVKDPQNTLLEIGAVEIAFARAKDEAGVIERESLIFGLGLERIAALRKKQYNIHRLSFHKKIIEKISRATLHMSILDTSLALDIITKALTILDAWAYIAPEMQKDYQAYNRSLKNHYVRVVKEFCRLNLSLGISMEKFIKTISEECNISLEFLLQDNRFQKYVLENYEYI